MRAANSRLEHASAPHRDVVPLAHIVNLLSLCETTHPADFDIYDSASIGFGGDCGITGVPNRLI